METLDIKQFITFKTDNDTFELDKNIGPVNIATGKSVTIKNIIETLKLITGSEKTLINYDLTKPSMIPVRLISNEYLMSLINWSPRYDIYSGLKNTFEWYSKFYSSIDPDKNNDNL